MADASVRSVASAQGDSGGGVTVTKPSGTASGDVLVAVLSGYAQSTGSPTFTSTGWTSVRRDVGTSGGVAQQVLFKVAGGAEPASYVFTSDVAAISGGTVVALADAKGVAPASAASVDSVTAPSLTPSQAGSVLLAVVGGYHFSATSTTSTTPPVGMTEQSDLFLLNLAGSNSGRHSLATLLIPGTGVTGGKTFTPDRVMTSSVATSVLVERNNSAPYAPPLVSPVGGAVLDSTAGQRFDWDFSDPDSGDSQSAYELRYRLTGAATWTTVTGTSTASHRDFTAGFFADGAYEWQVRTTDALGLTGDWSGSAFFTVDSPPAGPSITDPVNGQTIATATYLVTWSSPVQEAYQLRTVADSAGSPNTATVYTDTGTVTSTTARSASVTFATNNRTEHVQVRVRDAGLWSAWASVSVDVSYTTPAVPFVTVLASSAEGAISVTVTNPTPSGGEPSVVSNDIWRRETAEAGDGIRVATGRSVNGTWIDYTPASGVDYEYAAVAHGSNTTTATSPWAGGTSTTEPVTTFSGF